MRTNPLTVPLLSSQGKYSTTFAGCVPSYLGHVLYHLGYSLCRTTYTWKKPLQSLLMGHEVSTQHPLNRLLDYPDTNATLSISSASIVRIRQAPDWDQHPIAVVHLHNDLPADYPLTSSFQLELIAMMCALLACPVAHTSFRSDCKSMLQLISKCQRSPNTRNSPYCDLRTI